MTIWDIEEKDSVFVSSAEVEEKEDTLTEAEWIKMDREDIATSLVEGGKVAVSCGGGYQVFFSRKKANFWKNHI